MSDPVIDHMLSFDPLDTAEKLVGADTSASLALGMLLNLEHGATKEKVLTERGDTTFHNKLDRYISIIESAGFEKALELNFTSNYSEDEKYVIYAHRDGLILSFDTYQGDSVNGGHLYYAHRPHNKDKWPTAYSSGGFVSDVAWPAHGVPDNVWWFGYHDAREALLYNIEKLREQGEFLAKWPKAVSKHGDRQVQYFIWLLHYGDHGQGKKYDYRAISRERLAMCPQWVQEIVNDTI